MRKKWDWKTWLDALDASQIGTRQKAIGHAFYKAMRTRKTAIGPWEIEGGLSYRDLDPLVVFGLIYLVPGAGHFIPDFDPLPAPSSIKIDAPMRRLLRQMISGKPLYRINKPGYITRRDDPRRWVLRENTDYGSLRMAQGVADRLLSLRLIEADGVGHGWPFQWTSRLRVNYRHLAGVHGFRETGLRWIRERLPDAAALPPGGAS